MNELTRRLHELLTMGSEYMSEASEQDISGKPKPDKWSKKEILGHLIDSAINNLQRFTEIQFEPKPYTIRKYNQDGLVDVNRYQMADVEELITLWLALNGRIIHLIEGLNDDMLAFEIDLGQGKQSDLQYLVTDYVDHMEHHVRQITS